MNYIQGFCRTNLDDYDCSRVEWFSSVPKKDDLVKVYYKGRDASLKVVRITHTQWDYNCGDKESAGKPYLIIELGN